MTTLMRRTTTLLARRLLAPPVASPLLVARERSCLVLLSLQSCGFFFFLTQLVRDVVGCFRLPSGADGFQLIFQSSLSLFFF